MKILFFMTRDLYTDALESYEGCTGSKDGEMTNDLFWGVKCRITKKPGLPAVSRQGFHIGNLNYEHLAGMRSLTSMLSLLETGIISFRVCLIF